MTAESSYTPTPSDRFTFGLWTVGNVGRDPFGEPTRPALDPVEAVERLAELGAYGVSLHDNDLVPVRASAAERDQIVGRFKAALERSGLVVAMATTNLFTEPAFKDGAFTANDPRVRRLALQKTMAAIDLGAELGAPIYVFWGGREGVEVQAAKGAQDALERYREALNFLCEYAVSQGYDMRFALEPKPNEPRGDCLAADGRACAAHDLDARSPRAVGRQPRGRARDHGGAQLQRAVGQALWAGKLFHVDLNAQRVGALRPGLPLRAGGHQGRVHPRPDARGGRLRRAAPLRRPAAARRGRRGHLGLRPRLHAHVPDPRARRRAQFAADPEIQEARRAAGSIDARQPTVAGGFSPAAVERAARGDARLRGARRARDCRNDLLDQLVTELLLGVR